MEIDEREIYVTPDGFGRAAIVRRSDGLFCVYVHVSLPPGVLPERFAPSAFVSWLSDRTPVTELYKDKDPDSGLLGTIDDARRYVHSLEGFADAVQRRGAGKVVVSSDG
jgi:hypothetical protein